jgi:hypothetical protein
MLGNSSKNNTVKNEVKKARKKRQNYTEEIIVGPTCKVDVRITPQCSVKNVRKISLTKFLKLCLDCPPGLRCFCMMYDRETSVKPFFDLDDLIDSPLSDKQIEKTYIEPFLILLKVKFCEAKKLSIVWANNSRKKGDQFKVSVHFIVNGIHTKNSELLSQVRYWKQLNSDIFKICQFLDTSIYSIGKGKVHIFRFSNQVKTGDKINEAGKPRLSIQTSQDEPLTWMYLEQYQIIYNKKIHENSVEFTNGDSPKTIEISSKSPLTTEQLKLEQSFIQHFQAQPNTPTMKQFRLLQSVLKKLPTSFAVKTKTWKNIGRSIHHYCQGKNEGLKVWTQFSKRSALHTKTARKECSRLWNEHFTTDSKKLLTIAYIINLYTKNCKDRELKIGQLNVSQPVNPLKGISRVKYLQIEKVNVKFLSDSGIQPKKGQYLFILSPTGTGKTYFVKKIQEKYTDFGFVAVVSRVSMAYMFAEKFGLEIYNNPKLVNHPVLNEVFQLDSLEKAQLHKLFEHGPDFVSKTKPYILFLDECNSLVLHILNSMEKMCSFRLKIVETLAELIRNAHFCICADADLTTHAIEFIMKITNEAKIQSGDHQPANAKLVVNTHRIQHNDVKVYNHESVHSVFWKMVDDIKNNRYFVCNCDNLKKLEMNFYSKLCQIFPEKSKQFKIYTSLQGNAKDFANPTEEWKESWVFFTSRCLYAIDFSPITKTHATYCFNFGGILPATQTLQQCFRNRKPTEINLLTKCFTGRKYHSLNKVIITCDDEHEHERRKIVLPSVRTNYSGYVEALKQLNYSHIYFDDIFKNNLDYHILKLLSLKGYTNVVNVPNPKISKIKRKPSEKRESFETRMKNYLIRVYNNKEKDPQAAELLKRRKRYLQNTILKNQTQFINNTEKYNAVIQKYATDSTLFYNFTDWSKANNPEKIENYRDLDEVSLDIWTTWKCSTKGKLQLMKEFNDLLGLVWFKWNIDTDLKNPDQKIKLSENADKLFNDLRQAFETHNVGKSNIKYILYQQFMSLMNKMFKKLFIKKRHYVPSKKESLNFRILNTQLIKEFETL